MRSNALKLKTEKLKLKKLMNFKQSYRKGEYRND